ncbi:MAG TPA: hypothetical protein VL132_00245, partial [Planctomycetaceae bacterium]|nr:hypothetical protein [Planctomycetaceae bacterium]
MSRGDKKHKKHVERQKKLAERSRHAETLALGLRRRARYPEIVFDDTSGDPEFVELIKSVVASIDFDSPGFCNSTERILYKLIREKGWNYTLECLDEVEHNLEADGDKSARLHKVSFTIHFGHAIFSRIPDATLRKFLPFNDLMVIPRGQTLILQFSSMLSEKGSGGTVFYSRR